MEESWRFRPIQGNICPTCSTSHYPFCSLPLPFDRNGFGGTVHHRLPNDPSFQRPFFDPFHDNRVMPHPSSHYDDRANLMTPIYGNPTDVYWNRNQNVDRDPIRKFPEPPMMGDSAVFNGFHRDGFNSHYDYGSNRRGEFFESDRILKRMKVDEMNSGSFAQISAPVCGDSNTNPKKLSLEDERRLNLIREHGGNHSVHPGGFTGGENPPNGYFHESSLTERPNFEESRKSDWLPRPPSNNGTNNLHNPGFTSVGQQQMQNKTNGFRSDVDHALFHNNSQNEQSQPIHHDQIDNPLNPSMQSYGSSNVQTGAPNFADPTRRSQDSSVAHEEKGFQNQRELYFSNPQKVDLSLQRNISHRASYPVSQASHGEFRPHDYQQPQPKDFDPTKEPRHPNLTSWQVSSGSYIPNHDLHYQGKQSDVGQSLEVKPPQLEGVQRPHNLHVVDQFGAPNINQQGSYLPFSTNNGITSARQEHTPASWAFGVHPPLPPTPPPPFPVPPGPPPSYLRATSSPQKTSSSIYPIPIGTSVTPPLLHSSAHEAQSFPLKHLSPDKPKRIDASLLLRQPHRATRPDHIVIILRGLPGSGKSYLAKMLRDLEVENGGDAPRIHSMDDYFMTEVEKVEEREGSKSSSSVKGRKTITKKVMEYCYEPEMEEAYRSSMLKAFKKTLEEGSFTFIIVDDRNLRVADFAQFWATAKRSGYEVYLLEATYKDPVGCAARNVHGFTSDDIQKMAELWEEAPYLYLQLDAQSLFHGDALNESGIQEVVDMDTEDVACDEDSSALRDGKSLKTTEPPVEDYAPDGSFKDGERWDTEGNDSTGVKELGRSKWSHDDEEDIERPKGAKGNSNALSGLIQAYSKGDKSVHWGDQVGKTGFSIGAAKKANMISLVIGPGAGYNLKSNPLREQEKVGATETSWESSRRSVFQEHLRAERESFRAVFDRRRQRIGGLDTEDE
ncbi:YLP motif-containing protein 1 [Macleaya cordata]|uniref:YLP motif-containing protein 1 n=1 Tax=Macleaya cordata TaxID=56857 RepID=A0A200QF18_MACCD|nr:YLP motif-containing protein 1 [Macleaya cordata]